MDMGDTINNVPEGYILNAHNEIVKKEQLRVFRSLEIGFNPLNHDFTILGFKKVSPKYEKGRKTKAEYKCPVFDEIIVDKVFTDVRENGVLKSLEITFSWYNEEGAIGLTKTETVKVYNVVEAETTERERRLKQIDYLVASAVGTPIESYVNAIFDHYYTQVEKYKSKGTNEFENAINAENGEMLNYLNIVVGANGETVKDSILNQIT